jgi:hypothetical protein
MTWKHNRKAATAPRKAPRQPPRFVARLVGVGVASRRRAARTIRKLTTARPAGTLRFTAHTRG